MSESLLRKEFKKSDVERVRNLVRGTYGNSTKDVVGYSSKADLEKHKEGDVWEEDGKSWTIEDGLKVSVSKLSRARELVKLPLTCPKCGGRMGTRLDKKMYPIHGVCFNCVTKFEDELRRAGLYKEYEKQMMENNMKSFLIDLKSKVKALKENPDVEVVTDEGSLEKWGRLSDSILDGLDKQIEALSEHVTNYSVD